MAALIFILLISSVCPNSSLRLKWRCWRRFWNKSDSWCQAFVNSDWSGGKKGGAARVWEGGGKTSLAYRIRGLNNAFGLRLSFSLDRRDRVIA
ncbi:30S ribosomal subunit protein S6 [Candidatus Hodgkinia cicadicola]|nr:30S ribosomal subunit protein S6 [Candidatus Hodgkinia cicadicola]